ncbi:MAG: HAMP domain-containing sensor histidine kinase [Verrucomicrobiota bacterium]
MPTTSATNRPGARLTRLWAGIRRRRFPGVPHETRSPRSPRLQLSLILLPVAALALGGMAALSSDRAAVESEARQRAAEVTSRIATRLSRAIPTELALAVTAGDLRVGLGTNGTERVPWTPTPRTDTDPRILIETRYAIPSGELLPVGIQWDVHGVLVRPAPCSAVPVPPDWFRNLSPDQFEAWERIQDPLPSPTLESASTNPPPLLENAPDPALKQAVEFHCRLALLRIATPSATTNSHRSALLELASEAIRSRVVTSTGLPLGAVALAEEQLRNPLTPLNAAEFSVLSELVLLQPSLLTPWLLDAAERRVPDPDTTGARDALVRLRDHWQGAQRRREIAARIQSEITASPRTPTHFWISAAGQEWLALAKILEPAEPESPPETSPGIHTARLSVRAVPGPLLGALFRRATEMDWGADATARRRVPGLPTGVSLCFNLEGRTLDLPGAAWAVPASSATVLSSVTGELAPDAASGIGTLGPRFTVEAVLTDPAALFAAHRQRQWVFGGLILTTAGVAGIGVRQAQRAFRRQLDLNREQSNFVSSVSHELRAPLASMRLLAEGLAEDRLTGEDKRREYARLIVRETRRLGTLVENVLDFARLEQGRTRYEFSPTDVRRLVGETTHLLEPIARERSVVLEVRLPKAPTGDSESANWDGGAVQQALVNLIDNALKHSPNGATVTVFLEALPGAPRAFRIGVRDQGPGIPGEEQERIFERFHRRGSELRRETQGIGLGLTLVRQIAESHHGRVRVESSPGRGATFLLELPENP